MISLRPYRREDCPALARLFYDTVHTVCAKEYSLAQLEAWADGTVDLSAWDASFLSHHTLIAEENRQILGFADMDQTGYLDRLYVHRDYQRQGIATALCHALERICPAAVYVTHASLTARPFFEHQGYQVIRQQTVVRRGIPLDNFIMEKRK